MSDFTQNLPQLEESQQHSLEQDFTGDELLIALNDLHDHKAPGFDGLPVEFYKTFSDLLGPTLLDVFKFTLQDGLLPLCCRRAVVCLIPKKGDLQTLQNWRPSSLLCADYKIFSKALVNRVKPFLSFLIHFDQCFCIPNRSIHDNIF